MDEVTSYIPRQAVVDLMKDLKEIAARKTLFTTVAGTQRSAGILYAIKRFTDLLSDIHCVEVLYVKSKN